MPGFGDAFTGGLGGSLGAGLPGALAGILGGFFGGSEPELPDEIRRLLEQYMQDRRWMRDFARSPGGNADELRELTGRRALEGRNFAQGRDRLYANLSNNATTNVGDLMTGLESNRQAMDMASYGEASRDWGNRRFAARQQLAGSGMPPLQYMQQPGADIGGLFANLMRAFGPNAPRTGGAAGAAGSAGGGMGAGAAGSNTNTGYNFNQPFGGAAGGMFGQVQGLGGAPGSAGGGGGGSLLPWELLQHLGSLR